MNAKEYLSQVRMLDDRINTKIQILDSLNDLATRCTSTISDMPKSGSGSTSRLEDTVIKIIDLQDEINAEIDKLVDLKAEMHEIISKISDPLQQTILEKRYICNMAWEEIIDQLYIDRRRVFQIHGMALKSVQAIIDH